MSTATDRWYDPRKEMPKKDQKVRWMDSSGGTHTGTFVGRWMNDGGLCIYYEPKFWQPR